MRRLFLLAFSLFLTAPSLAATCFISEYSVLAIDANGTKISLATEPGVTTQAVTYTTTTASAAFASGVRYIRIICDAKAHFVVGTSPTADATDPYVTADTAEYFGVIPGYAVAFYDGTT